MTHRTLPTACFAVLASLTAPIHAAEPAFQAGLVTEARTYERGQVVRNGGPNEVTLYPVSINRVTVALEGERITGEWKPGEIRYVRGSAARALVLSDPRGAARALARDFPLDTDVQAAIRGNELRLKRSDGTVVRARIVDRENSEEDEDERD
jgi:hypothetical protein